jgi:membrane protein CcdC involved in cytochrome C biogenesis
LRLDIIVPVIMSCALLWWVSRGMTWTGRLAVAAVTLVIIFCIVLFERSGFWQNLSR